MTVRPNCKVVAYYIIHYGREWLHWSISSIERHVDEIHVFYTEKPSHGHSTDMTNPETKEELKSIVDFHNCVWHEGEWDHEGQHRDFAKQECLNAGADLVLISDFDELWPAPVIEGLIDTAVLREDISEWRVPMIHFWRSLRWAIFTDEAFPTRMYNPRGTDTGYLDRVHGAILHMGYAQSPAIIQYKQSIHGHKADWRNKWFENIFMRWQPGLGDVHPTNVNYWSPVFVEDFRFEEFKPLFDGHPYLQQGIIR